MERERETVVTADEVSELVKEYALLGSREAREEAMEYLRFLREEDAREERLDETLKIV